MNRAKIYWRLLKRAWVPLVAVPLTAIGNAISARDEFLPPAISSTLHLPALLSVFPVWPWQGYGLLFALVFSVGLLEAAYREIRARHAGTDSPPVLDWSIVDALRYIARNSHWAASVDPKDGTWISNLERIFLDSLSLGKIRGYGRQLTPVRLQAATLIQSNFWPLVANLDAYSVMMDNSSLHPVTAINGQRYDQVQFEAAEIRRAFPPRSLVAFLTKRSPAQAWGHDSEWRRRDRTLAGNLRSRPGP